MVVLDVIHRIQAEQAGDLAVRWNCKAGNCGSCSVDINGKPKLACMTRMNEYESDETIAVRPIKTFPLIKELVDDLSTDLGNPLDGYNEDEDWFDDEPSDLNK